MFIDIFEPITGLLKRESVSIDNNVCRLHYKVTTSLLLALSLIVTSYTYVGSPIECLVDEIPAYVMDMYCWIHSTFTLLPSRPAGTVEVASNVLGEKDVIHHKYYQWVCYVLFFQAMSFYFPRYLWKSLEGGKMRTIVLDLNDPMLTEENKTKSIRLFMDYFISHLHTHNCYAIRFFLCEVLNFINVLAQMWFVNVFLDGEFSEYGLDVLKFLFTDDVVRVDPMSKVFPKMAKCTFHNYGPSGTVQKIDGLCLLPLNNVNEKIYVFLWFWLIVLAIVTGISLIYRAVVLMVRPFRLKLLRASARFSSPHEIGIIAKECQIGDWFILYQLSENIEPLIFKELVTNLASILKLVSEYEEDHEDI